MRKIFFSLRAVLYFLMLLAASFFTIQTTSAQTAYNQGKLAVLVVGDGSAPLSGAATPVFIKEFNTSGTGQSGTLRTTLPTIATSGTGSVSRALTQSGSSTSEGMLNLSTDRQILTLTGYNTSAGTAGVSTSVTTTFPTNTRVVAKVDASGVADTKTTLSTSYSATAIRSAITSDGASFWTAGAIGNSYVTNGNIGAVTSLSTTNTRGIGIFNNQLYTSSQSATIRLAKVGTGVPISGTPTLTNLSGFLTSTGDPYSFVFFDLNGGGPDLLYVASLNTAPNGLLKYSSSDNGATWTARGSLTGNVFGVTGAYNPCTGDVELYITANTTNAKPNALYKFSDLDVSVASPANITSNGLVLSTFGSLLATAATNTAFGGVAFTPGTLATSFTAAYSITGPNGCDNPGVLIGLDDSETGVSYQLYNEASPTGAAIIGTGSAISFGTQHVSGVYTVIATNLLTGCSTNMNGSRFINAAPTINFTGLASSYCVNAPPVNLIETTVNGTFSGPGISGNTFNPSVAGIGGPYTISYSYSNPTTGCISISSQTVTVNPLPVVSFTGLASQYCVTASPVTLTGSPGGGTFSGPGISGNVFNPALAGTGGPYTITYSYTNTETGCSMNASQTVSVGSPTTVSISGDNFVCQGGSTLLTATVTDLSIIISNYQWVVTTIEGLSTLGNAATQSTSQGGTYNVIITNSGGCTTTSPGYVVTAYGLPAVGFTGLAASYCSNASAVTLTANHNEGIFSGPGITDNGNGTAIFNPAAAGAGGPYTITYSYTISGTTCGNSISQTVLVNALPMVGFTGLASQYCITASPVTLTGSPAGGTFSGPGISGNIFNPATAAIGGPYTIIYSYTDMATGCSKTNAQLVSVKAIPTASITATTNTICLGNTVNLSLNFTGEGPWNYAINGAAIVSTSNNVETIPVNPTGTTIYTLTSFSDANCSVGDWVSIATGSYHSLAVKTNGTLWAWGRNNNNGQLGDGTIVDSNTPIKIGTATNWAKVSTGAVHSLAIKQDGTLWAWGGNSAGQLGDGTTIKKTNPTQIGTSSDWAKIEGGNLYTLAIKTDGTLWAWGENSNGQLGDGTTTSKTSPVQIGISTDWVQISGGIDHSLAIKSNGTLWAWGSSIFGQAAGAASNIPIQVGTSTDWANIFAGVFYSLGIKTNGTLWAWGRNSNGQLGDGSFTQKNSPVQIGSATNWSKISGHTAHSMGIKQDGTLWAWGLNNDGQLGNGTIVSTNTPAQTGTATSWTSISAGLDDSHGMQAGGTIWSWGKNDFGQLGDNTNISKSSPIQLSSTIASVTINVNPIPSVSFSGLAAQYCTGTSAVNLTGSPAGGTFSGPGIIGNTFSPALAGAGGPYTITYSYTNISTGCSNSISHTVTVNESPVVSYSGLAAQYCITASPVTLTGSPAGGTFSGPGISGNVFDPAMATTGVPYTISYSYTNIANGCGSTYTQQVSVNSVPAATLTAPVNAICGAVPANLVLNFTGTGPWNYSINGASIVNTSNNPETIVVNPVATTTYNLTSLSNAAGCNANEWASIATGSYHSLAIKADGSLWAWGRNNQDGQLGDGTIVDKNVPVQIGASSNWAKVAAGAVHSLGIKADGTLWAWGANDFGQLGDGTTVKKTSPVQIGTSNDWAKIDGGHLYSLAIKTDGTLWAWGQNFDGELGDGTTISKNTPVQIGTSTNWISVSGGVDHSLGIKSDGTLWAWGWGVFGQTGGAASTVPIQVGTSTDWVNIFAGQYYSLGIKTGGTLWAWGRNNFGELGTGNYFQMNSPIQIGSATNWTKVTGHSSHSLGIRQDGTLWAWGNNNNGQFGNGTITSSNAPVQIGSATNWANISAGLNDSHGMKTGNGTLWSWGLNQDGQLGDGTNTDKSSPVQVTAPFSSVSITVNPLPTVNFNGLASQYCANASAVTLTGSPSGGTFSGPGISGNTFNPAVAGAGGPFTVTYTYTNVSTGCSNSTSKTVTVNPSPIVSFTGLASQYCVNASAVTLNGSPTGGTFSGPGISSNTFNPATAGAGGPYTITYTYTNVSTGCSNSTSKTVTVNPLPVVTFTGLVAVYCTLDAVVTLTGNPTGGVFSGSGIVGNTFDPVLAGVGGPYTITYTYADPVTSCSNIYTQNVTVNAAQNWYLDVDNDGYYVSSILACSSPGAGYNQTATVLGDCNDNNSAVHPGAVDICGNGIDEDCNGSDAICGATLAFDGVNDNVSLPNSLAVSATSPSNTAITIEYWFKGSNVQSAVRFQDDNGYIVAGWSSFGQPIHIISTDNGINGIGINPIVNNGNWHHVAMTWEKNTINGFKSYVDGQLFQQRNSANANLPLISTGANLGSYRAVGEFMDGQLDEVRIWNRALCQEEIQSRMNCEIPGAETGLLANYHFNQGVASSINTGINTLSDASGNNYNGTLNNYALSGSTSNWIEPGAVVSGISCSGIIAAPEINVLGNGLGVADNSTITTTFNYTDFGSVNVGGSRVRTFTIQNTGTASLTISGIAMTGTNQSMFAIGALAPASPIAPGNSATFTVTFSATSPGTKTATVVIYNNDCDESIYDFAVEALSECPTVSFTGLATTYCSNDPLVTLTGNPSGGIFSGPGISGNSFDPAAAGAGTHSITYTYADGNGCSSSESQQVAVSVCTPVYTTLNLTAFLEGFYSDINTMRANIYDLGISTDPSETDTVTVNLWSQESLSNSEPDHSIKAVLHTDGMATMQFPASVSGNSFYIAVKHRNHMETWSKLPVTFTSTTDYNFSSGINKAYDDGVNAPMAHMPDGIYAFYSGDITQDGAIDAQDMNTIDNELGFFGYNISDVNGDGATDAQDMNFVDNNSQVGLFFARPY